MLRIRADESGVGFCSERCKRAQGESVTCHCVCRGRNHGIYKRRRQPPLPFEDEVIDWKLK